MPGRVTHTAVTLSIATATLPLYLHLSPGVCIPLTLGVLVTTPVTVKVFGQKLSIYLNPDMDIRRNSHVLADMLGFDAYEKSISHRSGMRAKHWRLAIKQHWRIITFSHIPFAGTLPRFLMLFFPVLILLLVVGQEGLLRPEWVWWFFVGMSLSDTGHLLADKSKDIYLGVRRFYANQSR